MDKSKGGDTPSTDKWMEHCVTQVMKSGKDKSSAIAICKVTYKKMQDKKSGGDTNSPDQSKSSVYRSSNPDIHITIE